MKSPNAVNANLPSLLIEIVSTPHSEQQNITLFPKEKSILRAKILKR